MEKTAGEEIRPILTDEEYFNAAQEIYELRCDRFFEYYEYIDMYRPPSARKREKTPEAEAKAKTLDVKIENLEEEFEKRIAAGTGKGAHFVIEDFARKLNLSGFQKTVVLTLMNLSIRTHTPESDTTALIEFIDFSACSFTKLLRKKEFRAGGRLMDSKILLARSNGPISQEKSVVYLDPKIQNKLLAAFSGEDCDWGEEDRGNVEEDKCPAGAPLEPSYRIEDVVITEKHSEKIRKYLDGYTKIGGAKQGIKDKYLAFLFYGPPGTGKTMLGEAIASHAGRKIVFAKYEELMNMYLGETEKKLDRLFKYASKNNVVLLIDEVDSLVYERKLAHREYVTQITNSFMGCIDRFKGILVLTTNLETRLDSALERRLTLKVKFEKPGFELRKKIWKSHVDRLAEDLKVPRDIDYDYLAGEFEFSGGEIKNAVKNAALMAFSKDNKRVTFEELVAGARDHEDGKFSEKKSARKIRGFSN